MRRGRDLVNSVITGLGSHILQQSNYTPNLRLKKAMRDPEGQRKGVHLGDRGEEAGGSEQPETFHDADMDEGENHEPKQPGSESEQQRQSGAPRAKQRLFGEDAAPASATAAPTSAPPPPNSPDAGLAEILAQLQKIQLGQKEAAQAVASVQEQLGALRQDFNQVLTRLQRAEGQAQEALEKAQAALDKVGVARKAGDAAGKRADEAHQEAQAAMQVATRGEATTTKATAQASRAEQKAAGAELKATEAKNDVAALQQVVTQLSETVGKLQRPVSYAAAAGAAAAAGGSAGQGGAAAGAAFPPRPTMTKEEALSNAALSSAQLKQTARVPPSAIREGESALAAMTRLLQAAGVREAPAWAEFRGEAKSGDRVVAMELRDGGQLSAMNKKKSELGFRVSVTRSPLQAQRFRELRATSCFKQREEQELAKKAAGQHYSIIHLVDGSVMGGDYITLEFARAWDQFRAASAPPAAGERQQGQAEGEASGCA